MDKEREEILEKLREVKQTATEELSKGEENKDSVVQNVNYYGTIELTRRDNGEKDSFELYTVEIYDYESDEVKTKIYLDGQEVDMGELMQIYEDIEPIKDTINKAKEEQEKNPDKEKYNLNEMEQEGKEHEGVIGKDKEDRKKDSKDDKSPEDDKELEGDEDISKSFSTDSSGATSLNQMIDGVTLRNILNLGDDYEYIKPIDASKLNQFGGNISSKQGIVAIKNNGECKILGEDIIRQDRQEGNNSFDRDLNIGNDGDVEYKSNISSYQIVNRPNYYISISYDSGEKEVGTTNKEIKISKRSGREGHEDVEIELQKRGSAEYEEPDARKLRQEHEDGIGEPDITKAKQEMHEEVGCENDRVENIDSYEENDIHGHFDITKDSIVPGKEFTFEEWAEDLNENPDAIIERFKKDIEKNPDRNPEDIANEIEADYERLPGNNNR